MYKCRTMLILLFMWVLFGGNKTMVNFSIQKLQRFIILQYNYRVIYKKSFISVQYKGFL